MKKLILILAVSIFFQCCSEKNQEKENIITWKQVFQDGVQNIEVYDAEYNYTLSFDSLDNIQVIAPTTYIDNKIVAIKILNDSEMEILWSVNNENRIIVSNYSYTNKNELLIDKFTYTIATIPFPNNLASAKFIKESEIN